MSKEAIKLAFEKATGIPDAWTNPALMKARSGFIQGWEALAERDYERGFIDGMQKQMQSSVDKAVNRMAQPEGCSNFCAQCEELSRELKKLKAQPEQEPVAYFNPQVKGGFCWAKITKITAPIAVSVEPIPLYTTPPQRTWFGLTEKEVMECLDQVYGVNVRFGAFAEVIEAKLKEKNT